MDKKLILPPNEIFQDEGKILYQEQDTSSQILIPAIKVEFPADGGILMYHQGCKYPKKAWPFPQALYSIDVVKRTIVNGLKLITDKNIRLFVILALIIPSVRRKIVRKVLVEFADLSEVSFTHVGTYIKPKYYCTFVREVYRVGMIMAGDDYTNQLLVKAICMILEFDDAYRYRVQDIFKDFSKEDFKKDPAKELTRIFSLLAERDRSAIGGGGIKNKIELFYKAIKYGMWISDFKKPLMQFFEMADTDKFKMDECDWYHSLPWVGYDFNGDSMMTRFAIRDAIDKQYQMEELFNAA